MARGETGEVIFAHPAVMTGYLGEPPAPFGTRLTVTSIKGNLGHPSGAAGAQAVVAALCALRDRKLPHTAGTSRVDPEARFNVVTAAPTAIGGGHVQVNAFGFGGQNASLVLGVG